MTNDRKDINPISIQLLYQLWDQTVTGRERILAWQTVPQEESSISSAEVADVQLTLRNFARIGHLVERDVIPPDFVEEYFGKEIIRCHARLKPLVAAMRKRRGEDDYASLDALVARCGKRWPGYQPQYSQADAGRTIGFHDSAQT